MNKFNIKYAVAALLIIIPLYPKFPFIDVPGTHVSVRLEDFLILIASILWLAKEYSNIFKILKTRIARSIILFLLIGLISVLSGILITKTAVPHIGILHWARRVEYLAFFFIGLTSVRKKENLSFYIKCLLLIIGFAFIFGVGQKHFNWPVITTQNSEYAKGVALRYREGAHLVSTFAGHYDLATYLVFVLPIFYLLLLSNKNLLTKIFTFKNPLISRAILLIVISMSMWLLVNTASRISVVAYLGSTALALILYRRIKFIPVLLIFSILFISMSSNLIDRYMNIFKVTLTKIVQTAQPPVYAQEASVLQRQDSTLTEATPTPAPIFEDRSTSIRLNVEWPRALRAVYKNPLLGTGYSSITLATDNGYLRALGEIGILGFLAFMLLLWRLFAKLLTSLKNINKTSVDYLFVVAILSGFTGVMLNMVFIDILDASKFATMFWLITGIAIGTATRHEKN